MSVEAFLIGAHEEALANRGAGLELAKIAGRVSRSEPADPRSDRSGTDQSDLSPRGADALQLIGQRLHAGRIERAIGGGQNVGADLDHDGLGLGQYFLADRIDHRQSPGPGLKRNEKSGQSENFSNLANVCLTEQIALLY